MNKISLPKIHSTTSYDKNECNIGVVHLGFGAFHRAHQAVYLDDYMSKTNDLRWGIAAVNLRESEISSFCKNSSNEIKSIDGYLVKSYSSDGEDTVRMVRSHLEFYDWTVNPEAFTKFTFNRKCTFNYNYSY